MTRSRQTVIVIPTYNEADNINDLLHRVRQSSPTAHVLFVDDQSPDGTAERIREAAREDGRLFLLAGGEKLGLGAAYRAGFGWALDHGYATVVQMDADLSHPPEMVPALVAALDGADIAVG
ncbi:glycosyltransferase, partial [Nocardioides sp.]|uniref:glycosyltransferase n=1 Tax=Nocardioides sp. TaxID=35761 RepID=UPI00286D9C0A